MSNSCAKITHSTSKSIHLGAKVLCFPNNSKWEGEDWKSGRNPLDSAYLWVELIFVAANYDAILLSERALFHALTRARSFHSKDMLHQSEWCHTLPEGVIGFSFLFPSNSLWFLCQIIYRYFRSERNNSIIILCIYIEPDFSQFPCFL